MLVLEIAAGIVLAVVVLRFWRETLWIGIALAVLAIIALLLFLFHRQIESALAVCVYIAVPPLVIWASWRLTGAVYRHWREGPRIERVKLVAGAGVLHLLLSLAVAGALKDVDQALAWAAFFVAWGGPYVMILRHHRSERPRPLTARPPA